ncbi:MAG: transglutaminase-like domain-containing protein [Oscillospiraceae bacterium]|jgi:hypothetical protein|nr:transglutaminase-like domain-containing protein [Oscillospiraceae bacterium]
MPADNGYFKNAYSLLLAGALKIFSDFSHSEYEPYFIEYDTEHRDFPRLREKYDLPNVAGEGDDFSKAVNLMRWVSDNVAHNGMNPDIESVQCDAISILDYAFGKGKDFGLICRHQAIVFTECCLSLGLAARTIHCLPYSPYDFESHVVSMVYLREQKKWGLFDSTNNAYFTDDDGVVLSPTEARRRLSVGKINVSDGLKGYDEDDYKHYMAKNLFYIKYWAKNTLGTDLAEGQLTYYLTPFGFDVKARELGYCEYAIENSPENVKSGWVKQLEKFKLQSVNVVSERQFSSLPPDRN